MLYIQWQQWQWEDANMMFEGWFLSLPPYHKIKLVAVDLSLEKIPYPSQCCWSSRKMRAVDVEHMILTVQIWIIYRYKYRYEYIYRYGHIYIYGYKYRYRYIYGYCLINGYKYSTNTNIEIKYGPYIIYWLHWNFFVGNTSRGGSRGEAN